MNPLSLAALTSACPRRGPNEQKERQKEKDESLIRRRVNRTRGRPVVLSNALWNVSKKGHTHARTYSREDGGSQG